MDFLLIRESENWKDWFENQSQSRRCNRICTSPLWTDHIGFKRVWRWHMRDGLIHHSPKVSISWKLQSILNNLQTSLSFPSLTIFRVLPPSITFPQSCSAFQVESLQAQPGLQTGTEWPFWTRLCHACPPKQSNHLRSVSLEPLGKVSETPDEWGILNLFGLGRQKPALNSKCMDLSVSQASWDRETCSQKALLGPGTGTLGTKAFPSIPQGAMWTWRAYTILWLSAFCGFSAPHWLHIAVTLTSHKLWVGTAPRKRHELGDHLSAVGNSVPAGRFSRVSNLDWGQVLCQLPAGSLLHVFWGHLGTPSSRNSTIRASFVLSLLQARPWCKEGAEMDRKPSWGTAMKGMFLKILFTFRERRRREIGSKTSISCPSYTPNWRPSPQPKLVPWWRIELATLQFASQHPIHWATPVREGIVW